MCRIGLDKTPAVARRRAREVGRRHAKTCTRDAGKNSASGAPNVIILYRRRRHRFMDNARRFNLTVKRTDIFLTLTMSGGQKKIFMTKILRSFSVPMTTYYFCSFSLATYCFATADFLWRLFYLYNYFFSLLQDVLTMFVFCLSQKGEISEKRDEPPAHRTFLTPYV